MKTRSFRSTLFIAGLASSLALSGCLKTRAQLRNDNSSAANDGAVPVKVTDVESQNQKVVDELKAEIHRLTSRLDEVERTNQDLNQQAGKKDAAKLEETKRLETRIQELEAAQTAMIEALKKKEKEAPPKTEPVAFFEQGKKLHDEKKYGEAAENLTEYLKFPKGKHREEALYLRGESHYSQTQYKKAILDYSELTDSYPKSKRMPQTLMKIGLAFEALGMKADAKVFFQQLVDKYPKSAEAKKAAPKVK